MNTLLLILCAFGLVAGAVLLVTVLGWLGVTVADLVRNRRPPEGP